jgi:hypothetical protein
MLAFIFVEESAEVRMFPQHSEKWRGATAMKAWPKREFILSGSFDVARLILEDLHEVAGRYPDLKQAILVSAKRDRAVLSLNPLVKFLYSRLIREKEWRMKAEERLAECKKKLREAEDKLQEYRKSKPGS